MAKQLSKFTCGTVLRSNREQLRMNQTQVASSTRCTQKMIGPREVNAGCALSSIPTQPIEVAATVETTFEQADLIALRAAHVRANAAVKSSAVPAADRDDLIQEARIACWQALKRFKPARGSLRTFLEKVVERRIASSVRSARRVPTHEPLKASHSPKVNSGSGHLELRADIQSIMATLNSGDRHLVLTLMEKTPAEASRILGIPLSTLHDRMIRLRRRFSAAGLKPIASKRPRQIKVKPVQEVCNAG